MAEEAGRDKIQLKNVAVVLRGELVADAIIL